MLQVINCHMLKLILLSSCTVTEKYFKSSQKYQTLKTNVMTIIVSISSSVYVAEVLHILNFFTTFTLCDNRHNRLPPME